METKSNMEMASKRKKKLKKKKKKSKTRRKKGMSAEAPWSLRPDQLELWYQDEVSLMTEETSAFDGECGVAIDKVVDHICSRDEKLFDVADVVQVGFPT